MARTEEDCCQQNVNDPDHRRHGCGEIENQPPGFPSGMRLLFDKIHRHSCILIARTERDWKLQITDALVVRRVSSPGRDAAPRRPPVSGRWTRRGRLGELPPSDVAQFSNLPCYPAKSFQAAKI